MSFSYAPVALCVAQYADGDKVGALNCAQQLLTDDQLKKFRRATGWHTFIPVSRRNSPANVYVGQAPVASQNSMRGFRNWRPPTLIQQDAAASKARAQVCDATLCSCSDAPASFLSAIDEAEEAIGKRR